MGRAFGDLHAQPRLHLLQAGGKSGLGDMAQLRRAGEIPGVGQGHKKAHLSERRHRLSKKQITVVL
jgi:hypothetical protein